MAKPLLPLEAIFEKSLELLDAEGIEGLSTRRLAAELKCSTRTLYDQIGRREDLLRELIAYQFSRLELDFEEQIGWKPSAEHWCSAVRNLMLAHPNLSKLMNAKDRNIIVEHVDRLLKILIGAGFPRSFALRSCRVLAHTTISLTLTEIEMPAAAERQKHRSRHELLFEKKLIVEGASVLEAQEMHGAPEVFRNAIRWLVAGIEQEFAGVPSNTAIDSQRRR